MISQRLRGIDEDGEAIEGLAPKLQQAFKEYANIDIQDQNGELRSTYDILSDLAEVYPTLTSKEKQYLGELAAGNRQVKVLNSIVSNWNDVQQAVDAANNSVGSAAQENAAFMDSIQGRLNELQSTFQEFSANTIDSGFVKSIINAGIAVLDFVDSIGGLQTILIAVGGLLAAKNIDKISSTISNVFDSIHTGIYTIIDDFSKARKSGQGFLSSLSSAFSGSGISGIGLAVGAVTTALSAYVAISSAIEQAEQERIQAAINASNEAQSQSAKIFDLSSQYLYLSDAVKTDVSAKEDLLKVQKELIDNLDAEKTGIDNVTNSLKQQSIEQLKNQRNTILAGIAASEDKMKTLNDDGVTGSGESFANSLNYLKKQGFQNIVTGINGGTFTLKANVNAKNALENYSLIQKAMQSLTDYMGAAEVQNDQVFQSLSKVANEYSTIIQEYEQQANAANKASVEINALIMDQGIPQSQSQFDSMRKNLIEAAQSSKDFYGTQEDIESAIDSVLATMPGFSEYMGEADTTMESMTETAEEASQSLEDMTSTVNSLKEILANFAENGTFSAEDLNSLIELDPNLEDDVYRYLAGLQSAEELVEAIKQSSKDAEDLYRDNVIDKLWPDIAQQKQIVDTMSNLYSLDAQNYASMEEAKAAVKLQAESQKWLSSSATVSDFVNLYLADFQNYSQFEQAKSQITAGVLTQIQGMNAAQISQVAAQYGVDLSNFTDIEAKKPEVAAAIATKLIQTYGVVSAAQKESLQSTLNALEAQKKQMDAYNPKLIGPQLSNVDLSKVSNLAELDQIDSQIAAIKAALSASNSYDPNSFLGQLDEIVGSINVQLPETSDLLKDAADAAEDAGNAAADAAQEAVDELQELNDELQNSLDELNDDRANIEDLVDTVMAMLKQRYDDELERLDEVIEKQEEQRDSEIEALEAETEAYTDKIDAQLEALRLKEDEREFNKELEEKSKDLSDLQAELLALQLDDSEYGQKKRLELEEEIAEKTEELNEFQHDHSVDLQEDALEKEKENAQSALEAKKEALEQEYQATIDYYEEQRNALQAYLKDEWNLRQEAYRLINKGGQQLYEDLIEYNRHYGNAVDADVKQQWDKAYNSLKKYNDGQINVRSTLEKIASSATTLQNKIDALAPKIENARKKADSLKSSLDKSTSAVGNTISKVDSLTNSLNKAKDAAASIKVPNPATGGGSNNKGGQSVSLYASGRTGGANEWAIVDEAGTELITRQRGRLTYLEAGDGVVPNDITERLLALGANPTKYMSAIMSGMTATVRPQNNVTNMPVNVQYGDIVIQGSADQRTVEAFRTMLRKHKDEVAKAVYDATRKSAKKQGFTY